MTEPLAVTPAELRWTASYLAHVSDLMRETHSALRDALSDEGQAWGHDKIGNRFAHGAHGYVSQANWVDGSIDVKTELLDYYAVGLKVVADCLEQQDATWT